MDLEQKNVVERSPFDLKQFNTDIEAFNKEVPSVIAAVNPDAASVREQKEAFLAGRVENPHFNYPKITGLTQEKAEAYETTASLLLAEAEYLNEPHKTVNKEFIEGSLRKVALIMAMKAYNEAETAAEKDLARQEFMRLNIEMYGEPDRTTYYSLLSEKVSALAEKERSPEAETLYQELRERLPAEALDSTAVSERFRPSDETVEWAHEAVTTLYEGLLRHIPDTEELITAEQLCAIFSTIIDQEFEATDWKAVQKDAKAISVSATTKTISVPFSRAPLSATEARRLTVHELGVHMMTAMMGEATDVPALQFGLAGYDDTQEGIAKVVEQALEGKYIEAGTDHYITAGLAYYDNMDFRQAFEIKWRLKLLEDLKPGEVPTEEQIEAVRNKVFDGPQIATTRIFRGTDDLPIFKDLSYYNGANDVWQYLDTIPGDDVQLNLLLAGKRSLSREHQRVVLEARSAE